MLKVAESNETFQNHLKKVFPVPYLLADTKPTTDAQNNNIKQQQQRFRFNSYINHTPPKYKRKTRKSSIVKLATIFRPNILHSYLSYNEIVSYLDYIKLRFMDFVKVHTLGTTFERRAIKCIEINWNGKKRKRSAPLQYVQLKQLAETDNLKECGRNIVFIEGGTHAREWLSVTVALICVHQLTEKNARHRDLLRKLKFFIVPVVNPDGYEYARNVNPRWRKNRRPHMDGGDGVGTDCNRNFDFHWEKNLSNKKRNTYQGDKPFSEHETKALAKMLNTLAPNLLFYLSLHSYAQSIMYPWGYSKLQPKNAKLMESVAIAGRNAIKAFSGRFYRVGSISHITKRKIAGSVADYAHGAVKIPLTLVMELPSNEYGFQPPVDKIHALSLESWQGIREMCKAAFKLKATIEEEEKMQADDTIKDENDSFTKDGAHVLKLAGGSSKQEINRQRDFGKSLNNRFKIALQNRMSEGIIKSMLDVATF